MKMSNQFKVIAVRVYTEDKDLIELREEEQPDGSGRGNYLTVEVPIGSYNLRDTVTVTVGNNI